MHRTFPPGMRKGAPGAPGAPSDLRTFDREPYRRPIAARSPCGGRWVTTTGSSLVLWVSTS